MRTFATLLLGLTVACAEEGGDEASAGPSEAQLRCEELTAAFTPCGGDPLGRWVLAQGCLSLSLSSLEAKSCPERFDGLLFGDGVLELRADGTLTDATELQGVLVAHVPAACIDEVTGGAIAASDACALVPSEAERQGFAGVCLFLGECTCRITGPVPSLGERSFVTDGATLRDPADATLAVQYCVDEDQLTLRQVDEEGVEALLRFTREGS